MSQIFNVPTSNTFIGYSFLTGLKPLYNIDCVNQDLLNEINTRKGELVMDAEFGCIVWDLLFELKTPELINTIKTDLTRIFNNEPRVQLQQLVIQDIQNVYVGFATLYYNQFATSQQLNLTFTSNLAVAGQNQTGN